MSTSLAQVLSEKEKHHSWLQGRLKEDNVIFKGQCKEDQKQSIELCVEEPRKR